MAKYVKNDVPSGYSTTQINDELAKIDAAIDDHLDRKGGTGNQMEADIDMNSNDLLNVKAIGVQSMSIAGTQVTATDFATTTLPSQSGNSGKVLGTNGTTASWEDRETYVYPAQATEAGSYLTTDGSSVSWGRLFKEYSSLADVLADTDLQNGDNVRVLGVGDATIVNTNPSGYYQELTKGGLYIKPLGLSVNVMMYGAKVDGLTDDLSAWNNAFGDKDTVYIHSSDQSNISDSLTIPAGKSLIVHGSPTLHLTAKTGADSVGVLVLSTDSKVKGALTLTHDAAITASGLSADTADNIYAEEVVANGVDYGGIYLNAVTNSVISRCEASSTGGTFLGGALSTRNSSDVVFDRCYASNVTGKSFSSTDDSRVGFVECVSDSPSNDGFYLGSGAVDCYIENPTSLNPGANGIKLSRTALRSRVSGGYTEKLSATGAGNALRVQGTTDSDISNIYVKSEAGEGVLVTEHSTVSQPSIGCKITNPVVESSGTNGIRVIRDSGLAGVFVEDVTIVNPVVGGASTSLFIQDVTNWKVIGGKSSSVTTRHCTLNVTAGNQGVFTKGKMSGFSIEGGGFDGVVSTRYDDVEIDVIALDGDTTSDAIRVLESDNVTINKSKVDGYNNACRVTSNCGFIKVVDNGFYNCTTGLRQENTDMLQQGNEWSTCTTPVTPVTPPSGTIRIGNGGTEIKVAGEDAALSSGNTGGTGSAGAGNQYVELNIDGTIYKVLHDGTV